VRLTELLDESGLPEGSEKYIRGEALSPEELERVLGRTLEKAGIAAPEKGERTVKKTRFGILLLAGILCAGAVVASAAAYFQMDNRLAKELGAASGTVDGNPIQTSAVSEGWTLTLRQAVGTAAAPICSWT